MNRHTRQIPGLASTSIAVRTFKKLLLIGTVLTCSQTGLARVAGWQTFGETRTTCPFHVHYDYLVGSTQKRIGYFQDNKMVYALLDLKRVPRAGRPFVYVQKLVQDGVPVFETQEILAGEYSRAEYVVKVNVQGRRLKCRIVPFKGGLK